MTRWWPAASQNPRLLLVSNDVHTSGIGKLGRPGGPLLYDYLLGAPLKVSFADRGPAFHYDFYRMKPVCTAGADSP